ncbi:MAG: RNA methyltransferase [Myxococcota bacterium]
MTSDRRLTRMARVLDERLGHVCCALEAVYHRHNVSAILRTCDALGVHRVHLVAADWARVSKGPARGAERWLDLHHQPHTAAGVAAIRAAGYRLYVADLADDAVPPEQIPLDRPVCLWFGAELVGVSPEARAAADGVVTVPMRGMAQSLNVSVAAAVTLRPVVEAARSLGPAAFLGEEERQQTLAAWLERDLLLDAAIETRAATGR